MIINPKIIIWAGAVVIIGWMAISALDAATEWESPISTIQDTGQRFVCPAPQKAQINFDVTLPKFLGDDSSIYCKGSEWANEATTSSWNPFWITGSDYKVELEVTYDDRSKTYYQTLGWYDTGLGGEQTKGTVTFVTDINDWEGECADKWSFVQGYGISYTCRLIEDGKAIRTCSGTITTV